MRNATRFFMGGKELTQSPHLRKRGPKKKEEFKKAHPKSYDTIITRVGRAYEVLVKCSDGSALKCACRRPCRSEAEHVGKCLLSQLKDRERPNLTASFAGCGVKE